MRGLSTAAVASTSGRLMHSVGGTAWRAPLHAHLWRQPAAVLLNGLQHRPQRWSGPARSAASEAPAANPAEGALPAEQPASRPSGKEGRTLNEVYGVKDSPKIVQLDHHARRRERELQEIIQAARKLGLSETQVRESVTKLESLLPGLAPNLDKMKASDYARLLVDVNNIALTIITLKTQFPRADVGKIVQIAPKLMLLPAAQIESNSRKVRSMLATANNVDAIIEQVPYLLDPHALAQSLANISTWYNTKDPVAMLEKDPKVLMNVAEADLPADPLYGELTTAG